MAKKHLIAALDMDAQIAKGHYETKLSELQMTLVRIQQAYLHSGRSAVVVLEGWDAAGKRVFSGHSSLARCRFQT